MKKIFSIFLFLLLFLSIILPVQATEAIRIDLDVDKITRGGCPPDLNNIYNRANPPENCVITLEDFKANPGFNHFWVEDPEITDLGRSNERARQFIYWVLNHPPVYSNPIMSTIWGTMRNIAYVFVILIAAILGIGFIVGQRMNFQTGIKIWPAVSKIGLSILYITFSFSLVIVFIQISEVIMKFFIENLGGDKLFNIYFSSGTSKEDSYVTFIGYRDLNIRVQEAAKAEVFLLKFTNITYYVMGVMLLLRDIILWFLLFLSPFLAILFPFKFIRNVGWIWIGVFFQWLCYGPLFALFLGSLAKIWQNGIPFIFGFEGRVGTAVGYIYPTAISILYGGPAQKIGELNNGNFADTFVEYVITLIMLWTVIFLPWWLLRIFRDYCCDGIYAMKNILLSMYDQMRLGPNQPPPAHAPAPSKMNTNINVPDKVDIQSKIKLETITQIKQAKTEEITKSMNLSVHKLTDVARFETNKEVQQTTRRNIELLSNPMKADTPAERQKYMNIRTELFNRAIKEDSVAKGVLSATSTSKVEQIQRRQEMLKTTPVSAPVASTISYKLNISQAKVSSINSTLANAIMSNNIALNSIAQSSKVTAQQISSVLSTYHQNINQPPRQIIKTIQKETGLTKDQITEILKAVQKTLAENNNLKKEVAEKENVDEEQVQEVMAEQVPLLSEPEKNVEQTIAIPASISIEDYEEVKKMWAQQYEKGEVPVSENITSRDQWIEQDIVLLSNTLNKLTSTDENLRQQGMEEVGYILPIFMMNNLKGEELLVYLKAKLEAAKTVMELREKQAEAVAAQQPKQEEEDEILVDVRNKRAEQSKTMHLEQSLEIPEEQPTVPANNSPQPSEDERKKSLEDLYKDIDQQAQAKTNSNPGNQYVSNLTPESTDPSENK